LSRVGVFALLIFLIMGFPLSADGSEDSARSEEKTESLQNSSQWEQEIYEELSQKVKAAKVPFATLKFVLSRINRDSLPQDRKKALDKVLDLAKKYDLELRRGKSYSRVEMELKRELSLSKNKSVKTKVISAIKIKDKVDVITIKEKKDKKIKEIKDKIIEKKEKEKEIIEKIK